MGPATGVVAGCVSPSDGTLCWTVRQTATTPTAAQSDGRETEEATGVRRSCGPPHHCDGCASSAAKTTPRASLRRSESEADRLLHVVQWRRQCGGKRSRGPPHQMWAIPAGTVLLTLSEASITDKTTQGTGERGSRGRRMPYRRSTTQHSEYEDQKHASPADTTLLCCRRRGSRLRRRSYRRRADGRVRRSQHTQP